MTGLPTYLLILIGGVTLFAIVGTLWVNSQQKTLNALRFEEIETRQAAKAAEAREAEEAKQRMFVLNPIDPVPYGTNAPDALATGVALSGVLGSGFNLTGTSVVTTRSETLKARVERVRKNLGEREAKRMAEKPDVAAAGARQPWWGRRQNKEHGDA